MTEPIRLGPFELHELIGKGGMGQVWSGRHRSQDVDVAVKVITAERARKRRYRSAFRNEVRAMARLDHPGIVTVLDYGEIPPTDQALPGELRVGSPYLVMERVSGGSLARVGVVSRWATLRAVLLSLLDALAHAHARGVIHRDLKPDNVLMAGDASGGLFQLTDFGIARATGHEDPRDPDAEPGSATRQTTVGTPAYMAPEQIRGKWRDQGPWTDLYALGCLAYRLASGHPPFTSSDMMDVLFGHLKKPLPPLPDQDRFPLAFQNWLVRMLAKSPARRFQRAADAAFALSRIEGETDDLHARRTRDAIGVLQALDDSDTVAIHDAAVAGAMQARGASTDTGATLTTVLPTNAWPSTVQTSMAGTRSDELPPIPDTWRRTESQRLSMALVGAGLGLYGLRPTPFVGRQEQRDEIWRALAEVEEHGASRALVLRGGAGHGKSRLAEWMTERAHEVGAATILRATHSPITNPTDGLARMVAGALRCTGLSRAAMYKRVRRVWRQRSGLPIDDYTARALAEIMRPLASRDEPDDDPRPLDASPGLEFGSPSERYNAVYQLLELMCRERPVLVWLDDVQWGVDALGFASHVVNHHQDLPLLLLLTVRDEAVVQGSLAARELADLIAHPRSAEIQIEPLSEAELVGLVEQLLRMDGHLVQEVCARAAGNPLFAVQLVGDWVQRGVLRAGDRGFVLAPGERALIPNDIHALWSGRVQRIVNHFAGVRARAARLSLEVAAALGQDVDQREWEVACDIAGVSIPEGLVDELVAYRLASAGDGWSFAHGMLRESIERTATEAGRMIDHQRACVRMLQQLYQPDHPGIAERRIRHLLATGDAGSAIEPLRRAIAERIGTGDFDVAVELIDEWDHLLQTLAAPEHDPRWAEGWLWRARACAKRGMLTQCEQYVARAREAARRHEWLHVLAEVSWLTGQIHNKRGNLEDGIASCYEALKLYDAVGALGGVAHALYGLAEMRKLQGDLSEAIRSYREAIQVFEDSGYAGESVGSALTGLSDTYRRKGDYDRALELSARAVDYLRRRGYMHALAIGLNGRGDIYRNLGDLDQAEADYRAAIELFAAQASGDVAFSRANLAIVLIERGNYAEARDLLALARTAFEAEGRTGYLSFVYALLLPCVAAVGAWDQWDVHVGCAAHYLDAAHLVDEDLARPLMLAGELCLEAGHDARARAVYQLAHAQWIGLDRVDEARDVARRIENLPDAG